MKKFFVSLIISFFFATNLFAYTPTEKDQSNLNNIYKKIDLIYEKKPDSIQKLYSQIQKSKDKYIKNEKIYYLLTSLESYIWWKIEVKVENNKYQVIEVIDWDTFSFTWSDNKKYSVRMIWIDAPESSAIRFWHAEDFGTWAKAILKELIEWKTIKLEYDESQWKTDKYNRVLAYAFLWDININQKMIDLWFAKEYTYNKAYKYQKEFKESESKAKENKLWIWVNPIINTTNTWTTNTIETNTTTTNSSTSTSTYSSGRNYYTWPRWGCYYYNSNWNKIYVDHSFCN